MKDDPAPYRQQAEQLGPGARSRTPGMATGTCAPSMMMARRWVRSENNECQIDSIAQSWAVLSGAADPARAAQAMESVDRLLVKQAEQIDFAVYPALR